MEKYKGLLIPEKTRIWKYNTNRASFCNNCHCDKISECSKCLFSMEHQEIFVEWYNIQLRQQKLERILNV